MNLLPTNSLGDRFDCRYSAISCRLSAGSPPCVCYCATTYTLNWRRACFQTRTTRSPNHRHSSCIDDLEAALTADILPFPAGFSALPPPKKVAWRRQQIDDFAPNLTRWVRCSAVYSSRPYSRKSLVITALFIPKQSS